MKTILLMHGYVALVDDEDYERVMTRKWYALRQTDGLVYVASNAIPRRHLSAARLHTFVMSGNAGLEIDHKNDNGLDCRKENLRLATHTQNSRNRRRHKNNRSGFKGVYRKKQHYGRQPFVAQIRADKKKYHLGNFDCAEMAARAYDAAAQRLHGEFARLNFPSEVPCSN